MKRHLAPRPLAFAMSYPSVPTGLEEIPVRKKRITYPAWEETISEPPLEDFSAYYLTVLLAIAFLLASVQETGESRSA